MLGWSIIPIFTAEGEGENRDGNSGKHIYPLYSGKVNMDIVEQLKENSPWELIPKLLKKRKISKTSIGLHVQLLDIQRAGEYERDPKSAHKYQPLAPFIPDKQYMKYVKDPPKAKKLISLIKAKIFEQGIADMNVKFAAKFSLLYDGSADKKKILEDGDDDDDIL